MKKIFLLTGVAILAFGVATESWADKCVSNGTDDTYGTWASNKEPCTSCGLNCNWELNNGKLTISTNGNATDVAMKEYEYYEVPWYGSRTSINSVEIKNGITNIGRYSFYATTNLISVNLPDSITNIGFRPFDTSKLNEIIIPDSFGDENITLNSGLFFHSCFSQTRLNTCPDMSQVKIVCQGETTKCETALAKFGAGGSACTISTDNDNCLSPDVQIVSATSASQCTGVGYTWDNNTCRRKTADECNSTENYYYSGGKCQTLPKTKAACESAEFNWLNSKCTKASRSYCTNKGQVFWDDECMDEYPFAKKHWTPAEVNEWLKDDDNTITITFKK